MKPIVDPIVLLSSFAIVLLSLYFLLASFFLWVWKGPNCTWMFWTTLLLSIYNSNIRCLTVLYAYRLHSLFNFSTLVIRQDIGALGLHHVILHMLFAYPKWNTSKAYTQRYIFGLNIRPMSRWVLKYALCFRNWFFNDSWNKTEQCRTTKNQTVLHC